MENNHENSPESFAIEQAKDSKNNSFNPNFDFSIFNIDPNSEDENKGYDQDNEQSSEAGFFLCRSANDCIAEAKAQPTPRKLWYSLIFENEVTVLFADTGIGKSIYAVQIANELSKTEVVLYIDMELSDKQFQGRYSDEKYENEFVFNPNLYRVVFTRPFKIPKGISYEDHFINCLISLIKRNGAKIVIIDNMTRLISGDTDQAKSAKPLMDRLNNLKFDFGLTMLLLEHTKKVDPCRPIHLNDWQGSKMKANLCDAAFSIGRSAKDINIRYIKQMKVRSCEFEFHSENVLVYEVVQQNSFLHFQFIEYGSEFNHLKPLSESDREGRHIQIIELKKQGLSNIEIGKKMGITEGAVRKQLKKVTQ